MVLLNGLHTGAFVANINVTNLKYVLIKSFKCIILKFTKVNFTCLN